MRGKELQKIFPALGTVNTITLYDGFAPEIAEQVKKRVLDLHRRFSIFEQESDIFRINEQAGIKTVPVHQDTFFVLSHALAYVRETWGAFDITSGAASRLWRDAVRSAQIPSESDIAGCHSLSVLPVNCFRRLSLFSWYFWSLRCGGVFSVGTCVRWERCLLLFPERDYIK